MKITNYLVGIIFLFVSYNSCQAQRRLPNLKDDTTKLYVEYAVYNGYFNDSVFTSRRKGQLFLGKECSVYLYQRRSVEEFLDGLRKSVNHKEYEDLVVDGFRKSRDLEREMSIVYAKYYDSVDCYELKSLNENKFVWLSDTVRFTFDLLPETKEISGYKCQLAKGRTPNGDTATIWFTEEIPISAGPSNLAGLPGLILEYYSHRRREFYKAVKISTDEIPVNKAIAWLNGDLMDKKEYRNMANKDAERVKRMIEMNN